MLSFVAATAGQRIRADHLQALEAAKASGARIPTGGTVFLQNAQRYLALHYSRNQLATPRRWLPHVTASYTLNAAGKRRIGKRNNAVLRNYYDVVAMTPDVVALRPKPSTNATWEEDLAAARRDPC